MTTVDALLEALLRGLPEARQITVQSQFGLQVGSVGRAAADDGAPDPPSSALAPIAFANISELFGRLGAGATRALVSRSAAATLVQAAAGTEVPLYVTVRLAAGASADRTLTLLPTLLAALAPVCAAADAYARR